MLHLIQTLSNPTPFEYVLTHLQAVGWPAIVFIAWKFSKIVEKFVDKVTNTVSQIDTMATNHFPHMETSLANQDNLLKSMDASLTTLVEQGVVVKKRRKNGGKQKR